GTRITGETRRVRDLRGGEQRAASADGLELRERVSPVIHLAPTVVPAAVLIGEQEGECGSVRAWTALSCPWVKPSGLTRPIATPTRSGRSRWRSTTRTLSTQTASRHRPPTRWSPCSPPSLR